MTIANAGLGASSTPRELAAFDRATEWLNSPRLTAAGLQGKVVLVEFWTYTCINWLRTLPYVRAWANTYKERLTVIGVHTPEFSFEHDADNVRRAVKAMNIAYPVVLDNDYAIWRGFDNHYWPALYLLDPRGRIRHTHFGEGAYEETERAIQKVLVESGATGVERNVVSASIEPSGIEAQADWSDLRAEETYLRSEDSGLFRRWTTSGKWTISRSSIASTAPGARLAYRFHARDLHLVMGPSRRGESVRFRLTIDGRPPMSAHGLDSDEDGNGVVRDQRLYQLIRQPRPIADRDFAIEFLDAGAEAFSFTFG